MSQLAESFSRTALFAALLMMIAVGGSASLVTRFCAVLVWGLLVLLLIFGRGPRSGRIAALGLGIAALLGVWVHLQASETVWAWLRAFGDALPLSGQIARPALSLAAADSMQALVTVLVPFAIFVVFTFAFRHEEHVVRFVSALSIIGAAIALYGVLVYASGNDWLLIAPKRFYLEDLTAVFVNRNTAANFFGMVLGCLTALLLSLLAGAPPNAADRGRARPGVMIWIYGAGWLASFLALMLTSSRAGAATSLISVMTITSLCLTGRNSQAASIGWSRSRRLMTVGGAALAVLALISIMAEQIMHRIQSDWTYDPRFCIMPGMLRLWKDNWLFGTGLGTFPLAFPPYKEAGCGLAELWLQAHNFYLEGAITLGLPFLLLAPLVIVGLAVILARGLRRRRRYRWLPALGVGLLAQQSIHNMIDFPMQNVAIASVFAALIAACISVSLAPVSRNSPVHPSD